MINYRVLIRRRGNAPWIFSTVILGGALSILLFGIFYPAFRVLADGCFMVLSVLAVMLFHRYVFRHYAYTVVKREFSDGFDLEIEERMGTRQRAVCRIDVDAILSLEYETRKTYRALRKKYRGCRMYDYSMEFFGGKGVLLFTEENGDVAVIRISHDELLCQYLASLTGGSDQQSIDKSAGNSI